MWWARVGWNPLTPATAAITAPKPDIDGGWYLEASTTSAPVVVDLNVIKGTQLTDPLHIDDDPAPAVESFEWREDRVFGSVAGAKPEVYDKPFPTGFLAKIEPGRETSFSLPLPGRGTLLDKSPVSIFVHLAPTHEGLVSLEATWGDAALGRNAAVRGNPLSKVSFHLQADSLPPSGKALVLRDATASVPPTTPDDTSDDRGAIWIDSIEVQAVMPGAPGLLRARLGETDELAVRVERIATGKLATSYVPAPDPVAAAKGADEVILTTTATAAGAARLAAHRTARGIKAVAAPFADVVDRLGNGTYDSELIGRFLATLAHAGTRPRFVLLAGDAKRDQGADPTTSIPTAYVRTMYNGATPSDHELARAWHPFAPDATRPTIEDDPKSWPHSVGRLPFRDAATMDAYVDRVIAYETKPPADATRRLVRFVTSEGRFGPLIDGLLQNLFENVVSEEIPPAYDVEVTFASANSAYCWPPSKFHEKVIGGLNEGALFYTYVGHGWAEGFDSLRVGKSRFPILRSEDVPQVDVKGTPPAMFVVACTTATFDDPERTGVGELLLARPHGPLAYWGATRVCHPAWNAFIGRQIAMTIFKDPDRRIGEVLDAAVKGVLEPDPADKGRKLIELGARQLTPGKVPLERILEEGALMYTLLGDPAVKLALPKEDLVVSVTKSGDAVAGIVRVRVAVSGPIRDGTDVQMSIEVPRNVRIGRDTPKDLSPDDVQRARHASSNDKALLRAKVVPNGGVAEMTFLVPAEWSDKVLIAKAWCIAGGDVHQGAASLTTAK